MRVPLSPEAITGERPLGDLSLDGSADQAQCLLAMLEQAYEVVGFAVFPSAA